MSENEPAKLLLPYLQRADELQKHEPLVAYYCRLYAMERGLKIPTSERTKTTSSLLISLMKQLEKDKKSIQLGPDDHLHLEGFASNVFAKADKQDRAGRADISTAKTFYAASIFFEILNQFGELPPDLEQKQKYAVWKAADIRKAIKEGRKPVPGPPGGEKDLSDTSSGGYDMEPSKSDPTTRYAPESHPSSQSFDRSDSQNFVNTFSSPPPELPPPPSHSTLPPPPSNFPPPSSTAPPPPTYSSDDYQSHNYPSNMGDNNNNNPNYSQNYHHLQEPPQNHFSQNYPSHDPSYPTLPNFQSYPSFSETTLPAVPSHYPSSSYYQGSEQPYSPSGTTRPVDHPSTGQYKPLGGSDPSTRPIDSMGQYKPLGGSGGSNGSEPPYSAPGTRPVDYTSTGQYKTEPPYSAPGTRPVDQYGSGGSNGPVLEPVKSYEYDSSTYQPPPDKIAEAHKAARFAVGALAFDDVFVAVDYLKKSLELLTNPSANV